MELKLASFGLTNSN